MEDPTSDEPKAFEALTELAVLLRLLTNETNNPLIPDAPNTIADPFEQTTMYHVSSAAKIIDELIGVVETRLGTSVWIEGKCPTYRSHIRGGRGREKARTSGNEGWMVDVGVRNVIRVSWGL